MKTFIYALCEPGTRTVRYIGKTVSLKKRFLAHIITSAKRKNHLGNWLRSLSESPGLAVLHEVAEGESWQEEERRYISCARALGMDLVNATDGGEGGSGPWSPERRATYRSPPRSAETRARISVALTGVPHSPEWYAAIDAIWTPERRAAHNTALKGVPLSPERCAARSAAWTPERRAAKSAAQKGVPKGPPSPETCAAISAAHTGVKLSPEHCAAMSAGRKGLPWSAARRAVYEKRFKS